MALTLTVNGQSRVFAELPSPTNLLEVVAEMSLKADRIAIEHNGEIAARARWAEVTISSGDRLEVVHFVGGGAGKRPIADSVVGRHKGSGELLRFASMEGMWGVFVSHGKSLLLRL